MKKQIIIIGVFVFTIILAVAITINISENNKLAKVNSKTENVNTYRKIAWEAIDEASKKQIIGGYENSEVETVNEPDNTTILPFKAGKGGQINISGKTIITVSFHTNIDAMVGPIIIYIDPQSNKAIGTLPRL